MLPRTTLFQRAPESAEDFILIQGLGLPDGIKLEDCCVTNNTEQQIGLDALWEKLRGARRVDWNWVSNDEYAATLDDGTQHRLLKSEIHCADGGTHESWLLQVKQDDWISLRNLPVVTSFMGWSFNYNVASSHAQSSPPRPGH